MKKDLMIPLVSINHNNKMCGLDVNIQVMVHVEVEGTSEENIKIIFTVNEFNHFIKIINDVFLAASDTATLMKFIKENRDDRIKISIPGIK